MTNKGDKKIRFSDAEDDTMRALYGTISSEELGAQIGRSVWAVRRRARLLGLAETRSRPSAPRPAAVLHRPASGPVSAYAMPILFAKPPAPPKDPLHVRVLAILSQGDVSVQGLSTILGDKELVVSQVLLCLERDGHVMADRMPEGGRRAQRWRLRQAVAA